MPTKTRKYDLHYRDLEGDIEAEVVIIGGGFSCINTLLDLPEHNERACNHQGCAASPSALGILRCHNLQRNMHPVTHRIELLRSLQFHQ